MKLAIDDTVEDLTFCLECSVSALNAIHTAMSEGSFTADAFVPALFCIYDYQNSLADQLHALVDGAQVIKEECVR